jgi:hypothetical protein
MKKISELFSGEEKKHLSYLGSILSRPNTPFEQAIQDILDAAEESKPASSGKFRHSQETNRRISI